MGSFYFIYEKFAGVSTWWFGIGVVPGTTSPGSVTIEWVKLEKGAQATNYTPKSYLDELTACQRYFVKIATWQMLGNGYVDSIYNESRPNMFYNIGSLLLWRWDNVFGNKRCSVSNCTTGLGSTAFYRNIWTC